MLLQINQSKPVVAIVYNEQKEEVCRHYFGAVLNANSPDYVLATIRQHLTDCKGFIEAKIEQKDEQTQTYYIS